MSIISAPHPATAAFIAIAHAAEEHAKAGEIGNRASQSRGDGADQDVTIADVSEFMREHAFQFLIVEQIRSPG